MGHSAGASRASNYVAQTQFHSAEGDLIAGAIFVSAFHDLQRLLSTDSVRPYLGNADILREAFCRQGACPRLLVLPKHSHMSEIYSVGTEDRVLTDEILSFVRRVGSP
jgi:triacylglycerol lipase